MAPALGRGRRGQKCINAVENGVEVVVDFDVPDAMNIPALAAEKRASLFVVSDLLRSCVAIPIDFDDEFRPRAGKVRDVRTDRMLFPELPTIDLFVFQL